MAKMTDGFTKQTYTSGEEKITGYQKAAILLGELGREAGGLVMSRLKLTSSQTEKLNAAFSSLEKYNPDDENQVRREISVLQSLIDYFSSRGIVLKTANVSLADGAGARGKKESAFEKIAGSESVKEMVNESPDKFADILKQWIGEDEDQ